MTVPHLSAPILEQFQQSARDLTMCNVLGQRQTSDSVPMSTLETVGQQRGLGSDAPTRLVNESLKNGLKFTLYQTKCLN